MDHDFDYQENQLNTAMYLGCISSKERNNTAVYLKKNDMTMSVFFKFHCKKGLFSFFEPNALGLFVFGLINLFDWSFCFVFLSMVVSNESDLISVFFILANPFHKVEKNENKQETKIGNDKKQNQQL